jgi:uncharacterized membrane protein
MLVPFPIAYLVGALFTDLAYLATEEAFWATASLWLLRAGLVMGALAAVFGLIDFLSRKSIRSHQIAWHHFLGNAGVLALALLNLVLRGDAPADAIAPAGVVLSLIVAGILVYTAWLGGEMTYRYRIGAIAPATSEARAPSTGQERRSGMGDRRAHAM